MVFYTSHYVNSDNCLVVSHTIPLAFLLTVILDTFVYFIQ